MRGKKVLQALGAILVLLLLALWVIYGGGERPARGDVVGPILPAEAISARREARIDELSEV